MHLEQVLTFLVQERDRLNRAIEALQGAKRRGRPPKNPLFADGGGASSGAPAKRTFSAATRRKMAASQKKRWAAKKAAQ